MYSDNDDSHVSRVPPFGHLRIKAVFAQLPEAYRSYYVLHRLLSPRHPPNALNHLAT